MPFWQKGCCDRKVRDADELVVRRPMLTAGTGAIIQIVLSCDFMGVVIGSYSFGGAARWP